MRATAGKGVLIVAIGIVIVIALAPARSAGVQEDLTVRRTAFATALAEKSAERAAELFADEAVVQTANLPPVRGRQAIEQFYRKMFAFAVSLEATAETVRVSAADDMAYEIGAAKNTFKGGQGPVEYHGKYVTVWLKEQGTWRIAAYSVSSNSGTP